MMKAMFTATEIISILQDEGYRAKYEVDDEGNASINSGSQGLSWEIRINTPDEDGNFEMLLFTYIEMVNHSIFPVGKICNDYNSEYNFGTASYTFSDEFGTTDESFIRLDLGASFMGGVTEEWVRTEIGRWEICLANFKKKIQVNEETLPDDGDSF